MIAKRIATLSTAFAFALLLWLPVLSPLSRLAPEAAPRRVVSVLTDVTGGAEEVSALTEADAPETPVLSISDVVADEHSSGGKYDSAAVDGAKWRFGTFRINNPEEGGFILQVMLANGGVLKHRKHADSIRLADLVLVYRGGEPGRERREVPLSGENYKGDGFVYEAAFGPEYDNVQALYEMELWGTLDPKDMGRAGAGHYQEAASFAVEPSVKLAEPPGVVRPGSEEEGEGEEPAAAKRRLGKKRVAKRVMRRR